MKAYFSAGNTPHGFINYFDDAIDVVSATQILYIKGGSGVGKSTLMRKASLIARNKGMDVMEIYCSSDKDSLDGVVIDGKIALFDATMPHISDPLYPRLNGRIVDLGQFLDSNKLMQHKDDIINAVKCKKTHYSALYSYLASANGIIDVLKNTMIIDRAKSTIIENEILKEVDGDSTRNRRGFLTTLSTDGIEDRTDRIVQGEHVIRIESRYPYAKLVLVNNVSCALTRNMVPSERYYSLLVPDMVETIALSNKIITASSSVTSDTTYDIDDIVNIKNEHAYMVFTHYIDKIIRLASTELIAAKEAHNRLEDYYKSAMNYDSLEEYTSKLLSSLLP